MASDDGRRLWRVNELDIALVQIRAEAAKLDGGAAAKKALDAARLTAAPVIELVKTLGGEKTDLELQDLTLDERTAKVEKEMYTSLGLGPKDIALREKEMQTIARQKEVHATRLAELATEIPAARAAAEAEEKSVAALKAAFDKARAEAGPKQTEIQARYTQLNRARAEAAKVVTPALLARYDGIRAKKAPGMAKVNGVACGVCGTVQPERTLVALQSDRVMTCEGCSRILYWTDGLV